ncbi:hypothetical protein P152DRAFT_347513 [Eremomyces bilateralis CBS 781.70]|uniref:Glycine zipper 2TM domain-containing protein n=1 Tax=Eremomyces bilateralis CBS 781.70 TaxID=1392243 RepID=A0A6G1G401_9PEZI|nr:uncharacterized protein P152DRAFT_347513 [Eremomyces bilateralis CBS 781.70]KAF1812712.1 hypothetical protein P152DRAFT_347513 [Eremomyces bilateralis CBS 781.70]
MSLAASAALKALSFAAPNIPDKVFEMVPGGYYKSKDKEKEKEKERDKHRKHRSKSYDRKYRDRRHHRGHGRSDHEDERRRHRRRSHHAPRHYDSDVEASSDEYSDEEERVGSPRRSRRQRHERRRAKSVDARYRASSYPANDAYGLPPHGSQPYQPYDQQQPPYGGYPAARGQQSSASSPIYRSRPFDPLFPNSARRTNQAYSDSTAHAQHNTYEPYKPAGYIPHPQRNSSPGGYRQNSVLPYPVHLVDQGAPKQGPIQGAMPYIPYSDVYGLGGGSQRAHSGASSQTEYMSPEATTAYAPPEQRPSPLRRRSSLSPGGYGGPNRRRGTANPPGAYRYSNPPVANMSSQDPRFKDPGRGSPAPDIPHARSHSISTIDSRAVTPYAPPPGPVRLDNAVSGYPYATGYPVAPAAGSLESQKKHHHRKGSGSLSDKFHNFNLKDKLTEHPETSGAALGALAGGVLGSEMGKGNPWSTMVGAAVGGVGGREMGVHVHSRNRDSRGETSKKEDSEESKDHLDKVGDLRGRGRKRRRLDGEDDSEGEGYRSF